MKTCGLHIVEDREMSKIAYKGRLQTHVAAPVITADDRSACVTPPTFPAIDFRKPTVLKGAMICFVREAHRKSMCCTFDWGYESKAAV